MTHETIFIPLAFLIGSICLSMTSRSMSLLGRLRFSKELRRNHIYYGFFSVTRKIFHKEALSNHQFITSATKQITRILYATTALFYLMSNPYFSIGITYELNHYILTLQSFFTIIALIALLAVLLDFFSLIISLYQPIASLRLSYVISSVFLFLFSPLTYLLLKIQKSLVKLSPTTPDGLKNAKIKDKILEVVWEEELNHSIDPQDKKLILSVASFRDRIAREIMVPRIDVTSLSVDQTLQEATIAFNQEGYSRIPVYKDTVDNIIGVLLFKDILNYFSTEKEEDPKTVSIKKLLKPVLYTPETKKISELLQEFRNKQLHLAIVVDEYGGTEGIVTIEDILEELVGEIADEYDDKQEEVLFTTHPEGGWVVDGKMNINDIEKELGIQIPNSPEYDTIGGYIFERSGAIPTKGWRIHQENFDLEILRSSDRAIEKIRIIPAPSEDL